MLFYVLVIIINSLNSHVFVADGAALLVLEPLVDALLVVLVLAVCEVLDPVLQREVLEADAAAGLLGHALPPQLVGDLVDLLLRQPLAHRTHPITQLQQLLVSHVLGVVGVPTPALL